MFNPAIYITHKTLRQIVELELANEEMKKDYQYFLNKVQNKFTVDLLNKSQSKFTDTLHSEGILEKLATEEKDLPDLYPLKNALQAINVFETSFRAEDDWNLLIRINQIINREILDIHETNIRGNEKAKDKNILKSYDFENIDQLTHFTLELLRWYRTSDTELNRFHRVLTLLYHMIKTMPFVKYNAETIFIVFKFWMKENDILILNCLNSFSIITQKLSGDIELNDFLNLVFDELIKEKNKLFYDLDKKNLEINAPKKILNLNRRQIELLKILQARDKISRKEVADMMKISFMTAYRDIKGLLKKKLLIERGTGRATYYVLASK